MNNFLSFENVDNPDDIDTLYMSPDHQDDIINKYPRPPSIQSGFMHPITINHKKSPKVDCPVDVEELVAEREQCAKNYTFNESSNVIASREGCPSCGSLLYSEFTWFPQAIRIVISTGLSQSGCTYPMKECYKCNQQWHNVKLPNGGKKLPEKRKDGSYFYANMNPDPDKWVSKIVYDGVIPSYEPAPEHTVKKHKSSWCVIC
jgi:hypothetical protein